MKLLSILIENFKPFSKLELPSKTTSASELPNGLYTIRGRNSTGKSSLIEAFLWGLWGSKRDCGVIEEAKDRLIKKDASRCKVQLDFKIGNKKFRIKREKMRGKTTVVTLYEYNAQNQLINPISGSRVVCDKLESIMNCSGKVLDSTFFVRQGEIDYLANVSGSELRNKIQELFQLNQFDRIKEELKTMRNEHIAKQQELASEKNRIEGKKELLPELEGAIAKLNDEKLNLGQALQHLDDRIAKYPTIENIQKLDALEEQISNLSNQLEAYSKEIMLLEDILKEDLNEFEREKNTLLEEEQKFQALEKQMQSLPTLENVTTLTNLLSKQTNLEEQLKNLEDEFIPLSSSLEFPQALEQRIHYEKTLRESLQATELHIQESLNEVEKKTKDLFETINTLRGVSSSLESNIELLKEKGDCPTCLTPFHHKEELNNVVKRIENKVLNYSKEINQLEELVKENEDSMIVLKEKLENAKQNLSTLETITRVLTRIEQASTTLSNNQTEISRILRVFGVPTYDDLLIKHKVSNISELSESIGRVKNEYGIKEARLEEIRADIERLNKKIQEKENRIQKLTNGYENTTSEESKTKNELQALLSQMNVDTTDELLKLFNATKLQDIITTIQVLLQEKKEKTEQYDSLLNSINEETSRLNKLLDEINKLDQLEMQISQEESLIKHHDVLIKPYLEQFISQEVIQNKLFKSLRNVVSKYLQEFTYGQYKMNEILITRHGKTHGVTITLTDLVDGLEKDKDMLSGGDKAALGLALRMGISELIGRIRPFRSSGLQPIYFKTIILDEPLGSLDTERRDGVLRALQRNKSFDQIFLITHTQTDEDAGHTIMVKRARDTSIVELQFAEEGSRHIDLDSLNQA
ncbi:MAG: AAA family ATPase [Promethearchaeota archaeon]